MAHLRQRNKGDAGGVERVQCAEAIQRCQARVVDDHEAATQALEGVQTLERCQLRVGHHLPAPRLPVSAEHFRQTFHGAWLQQGWCLNFHLHTSCKTVHAQLQVLGVLSFPASMLGAVQNPLHIQRSECDTALLFLHTGLSVGAQCRGLTDRPLGRMDPAERSMPMLVRAVRGAPRLSSAGLNARLSPPPMVCALSQPVRPAWQHTCFTSSDMSKDLRPGPSKGPGAFLTHGAVQN